MKSEKIIYYQQQCEQVINSDEPLQGIYIHLKNEAIIRKNYFLPSVHFSSSAYINA